jgi:hypothetical protein
MTMTFNPYATGVLQEDHHERLVANLDGFAHDAGIHRKWLWTSMAGVCSPDEIDYVRQFNRNRTHGAVYGLCCVGASLKPEPELHMAAMAGALVRNFIRARVITLGSVIDQLSAGSPPEATCLLIPNFFIRKAEGGHVATWQVQTLYDLLANRGVKGLQTVVFVADMQSLAKEYGSQFATLIENHFQTVQI